MLIPVLLAVGFASVTNRVTVFLLRAKLHPDPTIASRKSQNHGRNEKAVLRRDAKFLVSQQQVPVCDVTGGTRFAHRSTGLHWRIIGAIS